METKVNIAGGGANGRAEFLLRLALRMHNWNCSIYAASSWAPNIAFLQDWHEPSEWLSDLTVEEQILFTLFIREAINAL